MASAKIEQAEMFEQAMEQVKTPRRSYIEHRIQCDFHRLVGWNEWRWPELKRRFSYPAGEMRVRVQDPITKRWYSPGGQRLVLEGMAKGVPDYWVWIKRGGYDGWICEFKAPGKYPTRAQKDWMQFFVTDYQFQVHVYRSALEAWESLEAYLKLPAPKPLIRG